MSSLDALEPRAERALVEALLRAFARLRLQPSSSDLERALASGSVPRVLEVLDLEGRLEKLL
jgi:hypothetical protein